MNHNEGTKKGGEIEDIIKCFEGQYSPELISKAQRFIKESDFIMDKLRGLCREFEIQDVKKAFVFTVTDNEYRMFVDYQGLLAELSK